MHILIFILIGIAGGVLGGLGMGGGTLLIPLLVLFTGLSQHAAQTVNLIAFIPMSIAALIVHLKNKLVKFRYLLTVSLPAAAVSGAAAVFVKNVAAETLRRGFGIFLAVLGAVQLIAAVRRIVKDRKAKKNQKAQKCRQT